MPALAIDGGVPVRAQMLPYGHQWIGDDDVEVVIQVLRSDRLTTGLNVAQFEEAFAAHVNAKYAVAVRNGTAALHAAVFAVGIEVIAPEGITNMIGIRPGEKLREVMILKNDANRTIEYADHYIIQPDFDF